MPERMRRDILDPKEPAVRISLNPILDTHVLEIGELAICNASAEERC